MPIWINTEWFHDMKLPRTLDVFLTGNLSHPLRSIVAQGLLRSSLKQYIKGGHPLNLRGYIEKINQSKIFPFGNVELGFLRSGGRESPIQWAIGKWTEAMACNTLAMSKIPTYAKELHFVPNYNFVPIDRNDFMKKIYYYLRHENERKEVARRGMETIQKYHSVKVRATEILGYMKEMLKK